MTDLAFINEMRHRCTISRATRTPDGVGGEKWVFSPIATSVRCLIQGLPIRQAELGKYRVWFESSVDVKESDQITFTSAGVLTNEVMYVNFVDDAAGQGHHLEVDLVETSGLT